MLNAFWWVDTRDMIADGLTKGAIDRAAFHAAMEGAIAMTAEVYQFISPPNAAAEYCVFTKERLDLIHPEHSFYL